MKLWTKSARFPLRSIGTDDAGSAFFPTYFLSSIPPLPRGTHARAYVLCRLRRERAFATIHRDRLLLTEKDSSS